MNGSQEVFFFVIEIEVRYREAVIKRLIFFKKGKMAKMKRKYVLYESALGYALFKELDFEECMLDHNEIQESINNYEKFSKIVKLKSFYAFETAMMALENVMDVSEGVIHEDLKNFLNLTLSKVKKTAILGVGDVNLGSAIKTQLKITCTYDDKVKEILRGIKLHFPKLLGELKKVEVDKAQLGLGHAYSHAKVKYNVNRNDNMIIQSISILDQLDKDINKLYMRTREWYGWTFPELSELVSDKMIYLKIALHICRNQNVFALEQEDISWLKDLGVDEVTAKRIINAGRLSMGASISESDTICIKSLLTMLIGMIAYREKLHNYLLKKMNDIAPNLSALIGEIIGARLISRSGSLTTLSKYPASTVQIIGAEKALFRALKTKSNTPKHGLIYNSSFISSALPKHKGRISRMLANKCSIASRIDCFYDTPTSVFGEKLKEQIDERLAFYNSGKVPKKNSVVMNEAKNNLENSTVMKEANNNLKRSPVLKEKKRKVKKAKLM